MLDRALLEILEGRKKGAVPVLKLRQKLVKEGRKFYSCVATTEVDWHVNVWSEQISGPQIYQGKQ